MMKAPSTFERQARAYLMLPRRLQSKLRTVAGASVENCPSKKVVAAVTTTGGRDIVSLSPMNQCCRDNEYSNADVALIWHDCPNSRTN